MLLACAVGLGFGLTLPTVTFRRVGAEPEVYSILTGVVSMWDDGNRLMAPIIFLFSAVFPAAKLVILGVVLTRRGDPGLRSRVTRFLDRYCKWSMLDVFIVTAFVGSVRLGLIANADSEYGIHVFGATVLLSMVCCHLVVRMVEPGRHDGRVIERGGSGSRWISTASAAFLAAACVLPALEVRKALLFHNEFALVGSTAELFHDGEALLAGVLAAFVLVVPAVRALLLLRFRWFPGETDRGAHLALELGAWAMLEVFGFGLVIVLVKLDELTTARALAGLYLLLAAGLLAWIDGWLLTRTPRTAEVDAGDG